jgi:hypothetical protein
MQRGNGFDVVEFTQTLARVCCTNHVRCHTYPPVDAVLLVVAQRVPPFR